MSIDFSPILISLKTGIYSIIATFIIAILLCYVTVFTKNKVIKTLLDVILTLPMVLPPTVVGFVLLYLCGSNGIIGNMLWNAFGVKITFTFLATVIAAMVISLPLMYRSAIAALENVDQEAIDVARTLSLSNRTIFFKIMLPQSLNGIVSGAILAFSRGLGEFGATSMLAGNIAGKTRTIPLAIYSAVNANDMKTAGVYSLIVIAICSVAVVILNIYRWKFEKERKN